MKKIMILLLAVICTGVIFGQTQTHASKKKVGIYIVDDSKMNMGDFAGDFMVKAIVKRGAYIAVDRTANFLQQLKKEQSFQQSGQVDGNELARLGENAGVNYVCMVRVGAMGTQYFMSARLVDVETAYVEGIARPQKFTIVDEIEKTCEAVTASLFGERRNGGSTSSGTSPGNQTQRHPAEPEMVFVQGGTFWMGCSNEQQGSCDSDESPLHQVTVSSFNIGKYEVTQAQWKLIMGSNPSTFKGDNLPVENVSWDDAQEFIARLNAATGKQYRLPTEAEWEYAARGGNKSQNYKYSGSHNLNNVAWFTDNSSSQTHSVGAKLPNELGIYDMSGNVWEWCSDWKGTYPASPQQDPMGASSGSYRVIRGGSWSNIAARCRVSNRDNGGPGDRIGDLGFRVALP